MNLTIPMSNVRRCSKLFFLVALTIVATWRCRYVGPRRRRERAREAREATIALDVEARPRPARQHRIDATRRSRSSGRASRSTKATTTAPVPSLARPEAARNDAGPSCSPSPTGCARATAGALTETDAEHGMTIRFQDESDRPLAPFLVEVAVAAREALARDLKVELPRPLRIELVRDLFTLAAMTGLPRVGGTDHGHGCRRQMGASHHDLSAGRPTRLSLGRHARPRDGPPRPDASLGRPRAALAARRSRQAPRDPLARGPGTSTTFPRPMWWRRSVSTKGWGVPSTSWARRSPCSPPPSKPWWRSPRSRASSAFG